MKANLWQDHDITNLYRCVRFTKVLNLSWSTTVMGNYCTVFFRSGDNALAIAHLIFPVPNLLIKNRFKTFFKKLRDLFRMKAFHISIMSRCIITRILNNFHKTEHLITATLNFKFRLDFTKRLNNFSSILCLKIIRCPFR